MVYISHPSIIQFEYNKITDYIYLGSNQCCVIHFKKELLDKNICADFSVDNEYVDRPFGVDYFFWLPIVDKKTPSFDELLVGVKTLKLFVDSKIKTYVHCKRGHGRSPTVIAGYFILEGDSYSNAIKKIREKRNIHMSREQITFLKKFEIFVRDL